ncbi:MAG: DUF418 domain-containing protein [Acidimicrobiaceae bacterium]|nr:DUF418 domain-containing protein [Acidimicrobiaceae bacterium]
MALDNRVGTSNAPNRVDNARIASLDVMRTIALFGIIVLNYHGYLNFSTASQPFVPSIFERWWHPFNGVLANPFPVGFVMIAGMGVSLLVGVNNSDQMLETKRGRLVRRGLFLFTLGYGINWIWPGTILTYYGAFFLVASIIATWSKRRLIALAFVASAIAALVEWWRLDQSFKGNFTSWLSPAEPNTPRNLLIRIFIDYTHPLFPWLAFFIAGILLGRATSRLGAIRLRLLAIGVAATTVPYFINATVNSIATTSSQNDERLRHLASTRPFDRGVLYVVSALGIVITVFAIVTYICERFSDSWIVNLAQHAGQMTLTIYLAHIFIYNVVVDWFKLITPTGLDSAIILSLGVYLTGVFWANWWYKRFGRGPAERIYRFFGG